jgi:hypothetical protein
MFPIPIKPFEVRRGGQRANLKTLSIICLPLVDIFGKAREAIFRWGSSPLLKHCKALPKPVTYWNLT